MFQKIFRRSRASFRSKKNTTSELKRAFLKEGTKSLDRGMAAQNLAQEDSPRPFSPPSCTEDTNSRKVKFKDSESLNEDGIESFRDEHLFDDSVLEAIEVGDLSIAEFLRSPHSSPSVPVKRSNSTGSVNEHVNEQTPDEGSASTSSLRKTNKRLSLLDRAHSMSSNKIQQKCEQYKDAVVVRVNNNKIPSQNGTPETPARFSKSLETLAQEVFGNEYRAYLEHASKSPTKISIINNIDQHEKRRKVLSPREVENIDQRPNPLNRTLTLENKIVSMVHSNNKTTTAQSLDLGKASIPNQEKFESWDNALDLRVSPGKMKENHPMPLITENKGSSLPQNSLQTLKIQSWTAANSKNKRNDSEDANYGSLSERDEPMSVADLEFPPPPQEKVERPVSFESDYSVCAKQSNDPIVDSLISVLPLPEKLEELVPSLQTALSEIITEVVSARQKLNRLVCAIDLHQQILKDQNSQIKIHELELAQLRHDIAVTNQLAAKTPRPTDPDRARIECQMSEMRELSFTLDKLITQCTELQITPPVSASAESLKRVNSLPPRKLRRTPPVIQPSTDLES